VSGVRYPDHPSNHVVDSARHGALLIGVDTDHTLQEGAVVVVRYPAVDNPEEPREDTAETRLNGEPAANATVTIE
jgi:hypothetical protein